VVKCFWENLSGTIDKVFKELISIHQVVGDYVPKPLDYGYADVSKQERAYFVTEYIEGAIDGEAWLNKYGKMDLETALKVGLQIAKGLEMAHQKDICHLDLKPANILLKQTDSEIEVKITDFGLSQVTSAAKSEQKKKSDLSEFEQTTLDIWDYVPPEKHEKPSACSDVSTFGRMLYRFLTGLSPQYFSPKKLPSVAQLQNLLFDCVKGEHCPSSAELRSQLEILEGGEDKRFEFETVMVDPEGEITERIRKEARYKTEILDEGVELEMVYIPGGTFMMGSPETERGREESESPQHEVRIEPFYMSKYPVTQAQWEAVTGNNPSRFEGKDRPVEQISWHDAVTFCKRLSKMTGKTYYLPSEAQWEYACRAGTTTPFYFGETITTDLANYRGTDWVYDGRTFNSSYGLGPKGVFHEETTEVGSFPPNAFGLYDMHGNVWEWCADPWHIRGYEGAPNDGSIWKGGSGKRILRGGSWFNLPTHTRTAFRAKSIALKQYGTNGFRVVSSMIWAH
jgi:formylglycine-generating enzyme required for sulfatase activity